MNDLVITAQPLTQVLPAGTNAVFQVAAEGVPPLTYQWFKDGTMLVNGGKIAGATTSTLTVSSISSRSSWNVLGPGDGGIWRQRFERPRGFIYNRSVHYGPAPEHHLHPVRMTWVMATWACSTRMAAGRVCRGRRRRTWTRWPPKGFDWASTIAPRRFARRRELRCCWESPRAMRTCATSNGTRPSQTTIRSPLCSREQGMRRRLSASGVWAGMMSAAPRLPIGPRIRLNVALITSSATSGTPTGTSIIRRRRFTAAEARNATTAPTISLPTLDKCYTTDLFTARAKKWIEDQRAAHPDQPFFLYLAFDTPHVVYELPTQAYPAGGGTTGGLQWLGTPGHMINTASGTVDSFVYPDYASATYDDDDNPATPEVPWPEVFQRYATGRAPD